MRLIRNIADVKAKHLPGVKLSVLDETHIYFLGMREYLRGHQSETLAQAYSLYAKAKQGLRKRSRSESRAYLIRIIAALPRGEKGMVRDITTAECEDMLHREFKTPSTRNKALRWLHNFFAFSVRRQWCSENPASRIMPEPVIEKTIEPLTISQIGAFLAVLRRPAFQPCVPAFCMMLWAGIRPYEVARLTWQEVDLNERVIYVEPRHSKTGGARQVTIHSVLHRFLSYIYANVNPSPTQLITPPSWRRKWQKLRLAAGISEWVPDTLRHTFASYHLKHFCNMDELQWEMGHRDKLMLMTRYLNLRNITKKDAAAFWKMPLGAFSSEKSNRKLARRKCQQDL